MNQLINGLTNNLEINGQANTCQFSLFAISCEVITVCRVEVQVQPFLVTTTHSMLSLCKVNQTKYKLIHLPPHFINCKNNHVRLLCIYTLFVQRKHLIYGMLFVTKYMQYNVHSVCIIVYNYSIIVYVFCVVIYPFYLYFINYNPEH